MLGNGLPTGCEPAAAQRDWARDEAYFEHVRGLSRRAMAAGLTLEREARRAGGTYRLRTARGEPLALFKPSDEEPLHPNRRLARLLARFAPNGRHGLYCLGGRGYKSEVAASVISQELGLDNVPFTRIEAIAHPSLAYPATRRRGKILPKKVGSLQVYTGEAHETLAALIKLDPQRRTDEDSVRRALNSPGMPEIVEEFILPHEFEKLCLLEFILGKLDGNLSNCLVTLDTKRLYSIDHTQAMPRRHTRYRGIRLDRRHWLPEPQYMTRLLPGARRRFSGGACHFVTRLDDGKDRLLERLLDERLVETDQATRLRERIAVLVRFARESRTFAELAEVRSERAFTRLVP